MDASGSSHCYAVLIYVAVVCSDGTVNLEKQIHLPFVPWARLMLEDCDSTDYEYVIESVYWTCRDSRFMCRCEVISSTATEDQVRGKFLPDGWIESA